MRNFQIIFPEINNLNSKLSKNCFYIDARIDQFHRSYRSTSFHLLSLSLEIMASTADIESSLEMREILQLEVQTLTKDEEALDKDISDLRVKKMELDDRIESQKVVPLPT